MALKFLKQNEIVDANRTNPLPTEVVGEAEFRTVDTLIAIIQFVPTTGRTLLTDLQVGDTDLYGSTASEQPTLVGTGKYRGITVFLAFTTSDTYHYRVYGRATDPNGEPFVSGWAVVKEGTFTSVPANGRARIDIGYTNPQEAYYDQYRIVVARASSGTADTYAKVIGVR